jgi:hypothetical protein
MNKQPLPLTMPSSTKTIVGLPAEDDVDSRMAPQRAQRTMVGIGAEQIEALSAFLSPSQRDRAALPPPAGSAATKRTLMGISEPPPPLSAPVSLRPSSLPQSFRPVSLYMNGPISMAGPRSTMPSLVDLPYERPMVAAAGVATAVALWALMMLYLFAM